MAVKVAYSVNRLALQYLMFRSSLRCQRLLEQPVFEHHVWKVRPAPLICSSSAQLMMNIARLSSTNDANSIPETDQVYTFPEGSLLVGQDNVITVVQVSLVSSTITLFRPH